MLHKISSWYFLRSYVYIVVKDNFSTNLELQQLQLESWTIIKEQYFQKKLHLVWNRVSLCNYSNSKNWYSISLLDNNKSPSQGIISSSNFITFSFTNGRISFTLTYKFLVFQKHSVPVRTLISTMPYTNTF